MKILLSTVLLLMCFSAQAVQLKLYDVSARPGGVDVDYEFTLDSAEVNTLTADTTRAALLAFCMANLGPAIGPVAAQYVVERVADVQSKRGPNGAWVKMTIRNGANLHVWDVYPL